GVHGSDTNDCTTLRTACKTIGHAIALESSGDTVDVAAATCPENLNIPVSLAIRGAGAVTTIIDGGELNTLVTIPNATSKVTLARMTIRNGQAFAFGGGIINNGSLAIVRSTLTGNGAGSFGGGVLNSSGAALTIASSTISGNISGEGGGIRNAG